MTAIMLVLTQDCNLACTYCYEKHNHVRMSFEAARTFIDSELIGTTDREIRIFLFGGEPFLCFDTIRKVVAYMAEVYPERSVTYAVTTNGTLIHENIKGWLEEHRNSFQVTISLDGTERMHDRSRLDRNGKGTFRLIDLEFFHRVFPGCLVKMTINANTIWDFADGIIYLEDQGFSCKANFASGEAYNLPQNREIILQNMLKLAEYYSANDCPLCYMLDLNLCAILIPLNERFRYCDAGTGRHCYHATDKNWYPCQGLMPMAVGHRQFAGMTFENGSILTESPCRSCPWVRICRTCYAMNYAATGNVYIPDPQICWLNRLCMLTSARIQYNRLRSAGERNPTLEHAIYLVARGLDSLIYEEA